MIRSLREGHAIWYAPDQSYRGKHSVLAPFFGVPAPTNPARADRADDRRRRSAMFMERREDKAAIWCACCRRWKRSRKVIRSPMPPASIR